MPLKKIKFLFLFLLIQSLGLISKSQTEKVKVPKNLSFEKNEKNFFPVTTFSGSTFFTLGAIDSKDVSKNNAVHSSYENKIKSKTSFTGKDFLLIEFESGNAINSPLNLDLQSKKGDTLKLSTMFYKFQINDELGAIVGPKMFGYHGLAGKSTAYNERIAILDGSNYTTSSGLGPSFGFFMKKKTGLNASMKVASNNSEMSSESTHFINQIGYTKKFFGGTITSNLNDEFNAYGLSIYFKPIKSLSISSSIEQKDNFLSKKINNWIFALQKNDEFKNFGIAVGTHNEQEMIGYEAWSEIMISDKIKLIPVFFIRENIERNRDLGFAINSKFSF